jgi:multidrug resistance protein, MATE family
MSKPVRSGGPRLVLGSVWAVSLPLVFAELGEVVVHVTDTVLLARVGSAELAAVAVGDVVLALAMVPALGLVEAVQIAVARRAGEERPSDLRRVFLQGFLLIGLASLGALAAISLGAGALSGLLTDEAEVASQLTAFLRIAAFGIVFEAASLGLGALCVGLGRTQIILGATVVLGVTNLFASSLLIFGLGPAPALGIEGAALGSVLAEVIAFVVLAAYAVRRLHLALPAPERWKPGTARSLVRLAWPVSLEEALDTVRWLLFFLLIGRLGEEALAASSIVYACYAAFSIPVAGFGETTCSLTSRLVGRREATAVPDAVRHLARRVYLLTLPFLALGLLVPDALLVIFDTEGGHPTGTALAVRIVALAMVVAVPGELWLAALVGTGDTGRALGVGLAEGAAMTAMTALVVTLGGGVAGAWLAVALAGVVELVLAKRSVERSQWRSRWA